MKAIAAFPGSAEPQLVDIPEPPDPAAGQVLVKTLRLGICGTDREILESRQPALPPGESFLVLGHECLGEVVALGEGVTQFQVGDRVVPVVRRPRGSAARRVDFLAPGQFVERGIFYQHGFSAPLWLDSPEYLIRVPPQLGEAAVFTEPMAIVQKAMREAIHLQHARLQQALWRGELPRVLVTGLGPIAFAALLHSVHFRFLTTVYGRDSHTAFRPQLVEKLGGRYLCDTCWQELQDVERDGWDLLIECTGDAEVLIRTTQALASCGVAVWLGSSRTRRGRNCDLDLLMRVAVIRNHLHLGSVNAAPADFQAASDLLTLWHQRCPHQLNQLFTDQVDLQGAMEHLRRRRPGSVKTVVVYS